MVKKITIAITLLLKFFTGPLTVAGAMESDRVIKENCLKYLGNKYGKEFVIKSYSKKFHGGLWKYQVRIKAAPADNTNLEFGIRYNPKSKKFEWDQYKKVLWESQAVSDAGKIIGNLYRVKNMKAELGANNSLVFNTSDLEFFKDYRELIGGIKNPRLTVEMDIILDVPTRLNMDGIINLAKFFFSLEFAKVEYSLDIRSGKKGASGADLLRFRVRKGQKLPTAGELRAMLYRKGEDDYLSGNRELYKKALALEKSGDPDGALRLYLGIVRGGRPYRYRKYIIAESASVVESAFRSAEILRARGERKRALLLYKTVIKKMELTEVPLKLSRLVKKSEKRIKEISGNGE